jgi:hypothetical protein
MSVVISLFYLKKVTTDIKSIFLIKNRPEHSLFMEKHVLRHEFSYQHHQKPRLLTLFFSFWWCWEQEFRSESTFFH